MAEQLPRPYAGVQDRAPNGVEPGPRVAEVDAEEVVLFLIGMRINRWRRGRSWWPVFTAMPRMLAELGRHPEDGLLDARPYWAGRVFLVVQVWRSAEDLGRFAHTAERRHASAWARFNSSGTAASGDVGIFHETYVVPRDGVETRYGNMARLGLGAAFGTTSKAGPRRHSSAEERVTADS